MWIRWLMYCAVMLCESLYRTGPCRIRTGWGKQSNVLYVALNGCSGTEANMTAGVIVFSEISCCF